MFGLEGTACPPQDRNGSEQKALPSVPCIGSASSLLSSMGDNSVPFVLRGSTDHLSHAVPGWELLLPLPREPSCKQAISLQEIVHCRGVTPQP